MPAARIVNTASMGSTMPDSMPPQNARPFFIPSARRGINNKKDCSTAFEEQHCAELTAYRAAAAYFKANNITKLPSPKKLEAEYHANNEKQEVPAGELPAVHITVVCGFNRKFFKQCNSQQLVYDMQFTVVINESNRELRWQGASYSGAHPIFVAIFTIT